MLSEFAFTKILEAGYKNLKKLIIDERFELDVKNTVIEESLNQHLRRVKNWAKEVSFRDAKEAKSIGDVYVTLKMSLIPRRKRLDNEIVESNVEIENIDLNKNALILGDPGAGKTTTLKHICHSMLNDDCLFKDFNYPILIELRDTNHQNSSTFIFSELLDIFGLDFKKKTGISELTSNAYEVFTEKIALQFLESQKVILILDGFDELPTQEAKNNLLKNLKTLSTSLDNSRVIITSRGSDFQYDIPGLIEYEIAPLTYDQIKSFSIKWLGNTKDGENFFEEIKKTTYFDASIRPLTIAHLCAIYERTGEIYDKPSEVYRKIVQILLEDWEEQRSIKRYSNYSKFSIEKRYDFLSRLAFELTVKTSSSRFNKHVIAKSAKDISAEFGLKKTNIIKVIQDLESHTGLILQSGSDSFEFAHKSIQEYLSARYIRSLPNLPSDKICFQIPHEMAITVALNSSTEYLIELYKQRLVNEVENIYFYSNFFSRLILERPSFNYNFELIETLCLIYTRYIKSGSHNNFSLSDRIHRYNSKVSNTRASVVFNNSAIKVENFIIV